MLTLSDFEGTWTLARTIEDFRTGQTARLDGTCRFSREGDALWQVEDGTLALPGVKPMKAERRYLWRENNGLIEVSFDDGRFFHAFDLDLHKPTAMHDCAPDRYEVAYDFECWPEWSAIWRVVGPRKDYLSRSVFSRL